MFFNNTIILSENEYYFIYKNLNEFITLLYEDSCVDCIYFTNYNSGFGNASIGITVITNDCNKKDHIQNKVNIFNSFFNKMNPCGISVHFSVDYIFNFYSTPISSLSKLRVEELIESEVIFDKCGYISNLKNQMKSYKHEYKFDIVKFDPPIEEEIGFSLYMKQKNDIN